MYVCWLLLLMLLCLRRRRCPACRFLALFSLRVIDDVLLAVWWPSLCERAPLWSWAADPRPLQHRCRFTVPPLLLLCRVRLPSIYGALLPLLCRVRLPSPVRARSFAESEAPHNGRFQVKRPVQSPLWCCQPLLEGFVSHTVVFVKDYCCRALRVFR